MTPLTVFDGRFLRASLFAPGRPRLVVTFRQRLKESGAFEDPRPVQRFIAAGYSHLSVQARWNDWYINPETEALAERFRALDEGQERAIAFGFSMGGYAALRFSQDLRLGELVAVSPQYSIGPGAVPFDTRYRHDAGGFDAALGDLAAHGRRDLRGVVLFDPFRSLDRRNADLIAAVFPGLALCRLAGGGHPATHVLRLAGGFGAVQRLALEQRMTRPAVLALHRAARGGTAYYWAARARACTKAGHAAAAGRARRMAARLSPPNSADPLDAASDSA